MIYCLDQGLLMRSRESSPLIVEGDHSPWLGRVVRFVFGAVFGGFIGLRWLIHMMDAWPLLLCIAVPACVSGVAAMLLGDSYWTGE